MTNQTESEDPASVSEPDGETSGNGQNLVDASPRTLGESELSVGPLAFGCWRFVSYQVDQPQAVIETALDSGMNLVDTADVYGLDWGGTHFGEAEELLGSVLASAPELRDRMVLATKGGILPPTPYDSSPTRLREAIEDSLRRLQVETIDLYQIHRCDLYAHPGEVAAVLAEARNAGKIREVGVSNHTPAQHEALAAHLPFPLATMQPEYSADHLDPMFDGTFDLAMRDGVTPLAWSPLGGGRLALGVPGPTGPTPELLAAIDSIAERENASRVAVCLAFVLAHPTRPVAIVGTQTPERITDAIKAANVRLDRADCYRLIEASTGQPMP